MKPRPHPLPKGKPEAPRRFQTITIAQARRQFARVLADVGRVASWRLWTARAAPSLPCWIPALEILANPEAMRAIRAAKAGRMEYRPLEETNKEQAAQKAKSRKRRVR